MVLAALGACLSHCQAAFPCLRCFLLPMPSGSPEHTHGHRRPVCCTLWVPRLPRRLLSSLVVGIEPPKLLLVSSFLVIYSVL
jgi:hypothetical protein